MKTKFYLLLASLLSANMYASDPESFPTSNAIWNISISGKEYLYGLVGDSIINDTLYHKLYLLNDSILNIESTDEYVGGFRIEDKQVWFRPANVVYNYGDKETGVNILLYDFSKNIGDTIYHDGTLEGIGWEPYPYFSKQKTASIIINGITEKNGREWFYTSIHSISPFYDDFGPAWMNGDVYIKNIGSVDGLFFFLYAHPMSLTGPRHRLVCFKQGDRVLYLDRPECCKICFYNIVVQTPEVPEAQNINIWYADNGIHIDGYNNAMEESTFSLFTLIGQPVFEKNISSGTERISLDKNLLEGTYLYHITKENNIIKSGKLIIK